MTIEQATKQANETGRGVEVEINGKPYRVLPENPPRPWEAKIASQCA